MQKVYSPFFNKGLPKTTRVVYNSTCMILTSMQNPKVKELKKLMTDKSLVFFDNPKLVEEAYLAGHQILYLIKRENYFGKTDYGGELVEVSENVFKAFSSTLNSQGLVGVVKFNFCKLQKPKGNFLVLDGLQDPGNIGTLIRSALGANFLDIYLVDTAKANSDKVVRSSMGAIFKTRLMPCSKQQFISAFKQWNLPLISCDMGGENIYKTIFKGQIGVMVGNEGNGVSKQMQALATKTISIPMQNSLESLNAGVAGSIVMYSIACCKTYN